MYTGVDENNMSLAPLRVVSLSDGSTAVIFTIFQYDGVDNKSWQLFCDYIREEVENIKGIFS